MCEPQERGFSTEAGVDWSKYLRYRPIYPPSFFERMFEYHDQKPEARWSTAHDVGAGAGIVSSSLLGRFERIIVSDPDGGHLPLARSALTEEAGLSATAFTFLQEEAEHSTVTSSSVDLITACECIHWMDVPAAMDDFYRQLRVGGSLIVTYYARPRLPENKAAERAWDSYFPLWRSKWKDEMADRSFKTTSTGLASVEVPEDRWKSVKRLYINAGGSLQSFNLTGGEVAESKVKASEEIVWVENDEDWSDWQGVDWLKGFISTLVPPLPASDTQHIWADIEAAIGEGKTRIATPLVMIFATKKRLTGPSEDL